MNICKINTLDKICLRKLRRDKMFGIFGMKSSGVWNGISHNQPSPKAMAVKKDRRDRKGGAGTRP